MKWDGWGYPLVNVYITMERSTNFNGKINCAWAIFNSYVSLPEGKSYTSIYHVLTHGEQEVLYNGIWRLPYRQTHMIIPRVLLLFLGFNPTIKAIWVNMIEYNKQKSLQNWGYHSVLTCPWNGGAISHSSHVTWPWHTTSIVLSHIFTDGNLCRCILPYPISSVINPL